MKRQALILQNITTLPLLACQTKVDEENFSAPYHAGGSFTDFFSSLSGLGAAHTLYTLRDILLQSHAQKAPIIVGLSGHAIETGLNPLLIHLLETKMISALVMTGQAMLQDVEVALCGHTLSEAEYATQDAMQIRLTSEAGALIHKAINDPQADGLGLSVGKALIDSDAQHLDHSLIATATRYHIPLTVHPAIGGDAFMLHPKAEGENLGATAFSDFRILASLLAQCSGGVVINLASSVTLPRAFSHALGTARNLGHEVSDVTLVMMDTEQTSSIKHMCHCFEDVHGQAIALPGPSEVLFPLLFASVLEALNDDF